MQQMLLLSKGGYEFFPVWEKFPIKNMQICIWGENYGDVYLY